jgi:Leucine-rich repeat (LRR) protein
MLRLNNTPVTDTGIQRLVGLSSLEELYLPGTQVTDRCLETLGRLPKLKYVSLSNTSVTEEGARRFMEQHSSCRLSR